MKLKDGVLSYKATKKNASIWYPIDTGDAKYNAVKLVIDQASCRQLGSTLKATSGADPIGEFKNAVSKPISWQGKPSSAKETIIVYLGDTKNFDGKITSINLNLGVKGRKVTIYSAEATWIDVNEILLDKG